MIFPDAAGSRYGDEANRQQYSDPNAPTALHDGRGGFAPTEVASRRLDSRREAPKAEGSSASLFDNDPAFPWVQRASHRMQSAARLDSYRIHRTLRARPPVTHTLTLLRYCFD